ncbi:MAG: SusC/RagA family TonB-linked outer membrane protein [Paludibacter sp.]|nr:SusC/RagA family TonB-linked outer membrane protein [Paludibacter sp.]
MKHGKQIIKEDIMNDYRTIFKRPVLIALSILYFMFSCLQVQAQEAKSGKKGMLSINLMVKSENGNLLPNAKVNVGKSDVYAETDKYGKVTFEATMTDFVTVSLDDIVKTVSIKDLSKSAYTIILPQSKLFLSSDDIVTLPFGRILKKRYMTGSSGSLSGDVFDKYPSSDIRNAFTGLLPGLIVTENSGSPGLTPEESLGYFGSSVRTQLSLRGRSIQYVIDGIQADLSEVPLDPEQIESVSLVKDIVGKSIYGAIGADGVMIINTKKGRGNEHKLKVNIETGMSQVDRMPEFVSGADYASLNNLARKNSGLGELYSSSDIAAYANNNPYDLKYPSVNFREMMLKESMPLQRINLSSTGGDGKTTYYAYLGYTKEGDLYKIGSKSDYSRINANSNINTTVNEFIKVKFGFVGGVSTRNSPNYGYYTDFSDNTGTTQLGLTEFPAMLGEINSIPPIAFPIYANNDPTMKKPWYGVTSKYGQNPIGNVMHNGSYTETIRNGVINMTLDYDLKSLLPGLKSTTYLGFNVINVVRLGKSENYAAYTVTPDTTAAGMDTIKLGLDHLGVDQSALSKLHDFYSQQITVYENLNYEKSFGKNYINASMIFNYASHAVNGYRDPSRNQNGILSALYSYNDKYSLHGVLNYNGSQYLPKNNRYDLFSAIGGSWVMSEESFMKNASFIDYLKLRAEVGVMGYEKNFNGSLFGPYNELSSFSGGTSTNFGSSGANTWFGGTTSTPRITTLSRIGNPNFGLEKVSETNVGIDALLLKKRLSLEVNYFNRVNDNIILPNLTSTPYVSGFDGIAYRVNNNKSRSSGFDFGIQYSDKIGKLAFSIGGNGLIMNSIWLKYDEPKYRNAYQSHVNQSTTAIRGLNYLGKFQTDAETTVIPQLYDAVLHAGDLKYEDKNGDGVVDDNDQSVIGDGAPKLQYALNIHLEYSGLELTVIGNGRAFNDVVLNNSYFWNGWGDNNYSKFVKDNIGGAYPNLTYNQVANNFRTSQYWMAKGDYFKIQNVELAYSLPEKISQNISGKLIRMYLRGSNLLTFSKIKDVDPESLNSGISNYPLFRTITVGLSLTF